MERGKHDRFQNVTLMSESIASEVADTLEHRSLANSQQVIRQKILSLASLQPGNTVVEIGCGTGVLLYECGQAVSPSGHVIGVEPQPTFAKLASRRLETLNCDIKYEVRQEPADHLGIPNRIADACIAQTVLIHLPNETLHLAIHEMARVTKSGGHVISVDQDGDTWAIDHPDRETTRQIVKYYSDQRFADGWMGRKLRRLFSECGLINVTIDSWNHVDSEVSSYLYGTCLRMANGAAETGYITQENRKSWIQTLDGLASRDQFFSSVSYFVVTGQPA
jgi:ubiquinone/menaquinone biosynthesis C-methylase UbiE